MRARSRIKNHKGKEVPIISSFTQSQRDLMMNMYLSSVVSSIEDIEKKSTMGFTQKYLNTDGVLNNRINPIIHNTELDKVDIAVDLMHCVSDLLNDPEFIEKIETVRYAFYEGKTPFADRTTRVKGTRLFIIEISRAMVFSIYVENWRIDISYKFNIGISENDLEDLCDKYNIDCDEPIPLAEIGKYKHEVNPIDKFTISVRECDSEINSKQINVMKNINISNRVIITHL